ncbi:MAG: hypothetical protein ISR96_11780 [Nitrospira sp.]|nr:hypothetical protein [Candidatus Brocadiales bacterium]MBL7050183.1 hypothetical protein [Nitrospira sp.]
MKKSPSKIQVISFICILLLTALIAYNGLQRSNKYSNKLMLECSEADTIRGGEGYVREGFLVDYGLPDICYGEKYEGLGQDWYTFQSKEIHAKLGTANVSKEKIDSMMPVKKPGDKCVYTHYPQASFLMIALSIKICGEDNISCFRIFPTVVGIVAMLIFALLMYYGLGPVRAILMMAAIAYVPISYILMPSLYYSSYAHSLLIIQLGIYLIIFRNKLQVTPVYCSVLFVIGFLQGWFSYDYAFMVIFSAIPFAFMYSGTQKEDRKRFLLTFIMPAAGFCIAHALHFAEIIAYFGGFTAFYKDLAYTASYRFDDSAGGMDFIIVRLKLIEKYLFTYAYARGFFNVNLPTMLATLFVLSWIRNIRIVIPYSGYTLHWNSSIRTFLTLGAGFLVSFLWVIIMKQHATHFFITLHLFPLYFFSVLVAVEGLSISKKDRETDLTTTI